MQIKSVSAKAILDSRKDKTISVTINTNVGKFSASSPDGKSKGKHEAKSYKKSLEGDIEALKKHVCVIPNSNIHQINVNTLTTDNPELLQALLAISRNDAEQILAARESEGFDNIEQFYKLPEVVKLKLTEEQKQQFVVDSEYFKLHASANFNNSYLQLNSILQVANNNQISVISRTIGRD